MHLPDGVLSAREWAPLALTGALVFATASTRARRSIEGPRIALLGFLSATVLVLQLLNFPLMGGASGHLNGTTLLVFAVGVESAVLAMGSVLALQALLFHDGGLLAIGANYVNMVVVPALMASVFHHWAPPGRASIRKTSWACALAAWLGSIAGALACALQLSSAGVTPFRIAAPWMMGGQALVGIIEGVLTAAAIRAMLRRGVIRTIHGTSDLERALPARPLGWFAPVLALAAMAAILVPLASERPDVLESLLERAHP
jgi:cobalt/nickel transport system permease protein